MTRKYFGMTYPRGDQVMVATGDIHETERKKHLKKGEGRFESVPTYAESMRREGGPVTRTRGW